MKKGIKWGLILLIALGIILVIMAIAIFMFVMLSIGLRILTPMLSREPLSPGSDEVYTVININGKETSDNGSPYYFYAPYKTLYRYSFTDDETVVILEEEQRIWRFDVYEDWIFYGLNKDGKVSAAQEIWEYNWVTGEKNLLLEDGKCTYVIAYNNYLVYDNYGVDYICMIGEDIQSGSMEMLAMFEDEDKSGDEQFIAFQGMIVGRYYNDDKDQYFISCIMEEEGGVGKHTLSGAWNRVLINGRLFKIDYSEMRKKLKQLTNNYDIDDSWRGHLTVEGKKIIGLASAAYRQGSTQAEIKFDFLFELNPDTKQVSILYRQEKNMPRIIGYRDGTVYLMEDYKLYKEPIDGGERVELLDLPEEKEMYFYWYGDYLIVSDENRAIIGVYLVE